MYWLSFSMTWVLLPMLQSYNEAGGFTRGARLKYALRVNLKFYGAAGVLFVAFLLYVLIRKRLTRDELVGFLVCLANVGGLLLVVLLLGYGLVEVPRRLWHRANHVVTMKEALYSASQAWVELEEARERLSEVTAVVRHYSQSIANHDRLRPYMDLVEENLPQRDSEAAAASLDAPRASPLSAAALSELSLYQQMKERELNEDALAFLNQQLKAAVRNYSLMEYQWIEVADRAIESEDVVEYEANRTLPPTVDSFSQRVLWKFRVFWLPSLLRGLAVVTCGMSLVIVWSEVTIGFGVNLSPFSHMVKAAQDDAHVAVSQLSAILPLTYMSACCYFSLFQLRLLELYHMRGHKRTDEDSLLYNASYMLRLPAPLGYNYLKLIRIQQGAFWEVVAQMDVIPFFGGLFNTYFPIIILLFSLATFFNVYGRVLRTLGITRFEYRSEFNDDSVAEGQMLLRKERRKRGRKPLTGAEAAAGLPPGRLAPEPRASRAGGAAGAGAGGGTNSVALSALRVRSPDISPDPSPRPVARPSYADRFGRREGLL